jgi:hypothetical protein
MIFVAEPFEPMPDGKCETKVQARVWQKSDRKNPPAPVCAEAARRLLCPDQGFFVATKSHRGWQELVYLHHGAASKRRWYGDDDTDDVRRCPTRQRKCWVAINVVVP